jgi:hypothetical protein
MRKMRGWVMPEEGARKLMDLLEDRLRSSCLDQRHHDALVRLREMLEDDLASDGMLSAVDRRSAQLPRKSSSSR